MSRLAPALLTVLASALFASADATATAGRIPVFSDGTTITAAGTYFVSQNLARTGGGAIITVAADDVTLDLNGMTLSSADTITDIVVIAGGRSNVTVENGILYGGYRGVFKPGSLSAGIKLRNLRVTGSSGDAIGIFDVTDVRIEDCMVESVGGSGIVVGSTPAPFNGRISRNTLTGVFASAILTDGMQGGEIRENTVMQSGDGADTGIIMFGSSDVWGGSLVADNTVSTFSGDGITVHQNGNTFRNNVVANVTGKGFSIGGSHNRLEGCQAVGSGGNGMHLFGGTGHVVTNCTVTGGGIDGIVNEAATGHLFSRNNVTGNSGVGIVFVNGTGSRLADNNISGNASHGLQVIDGGKHAIQGNAINDNSGTSMVFEMDSSACVYKQNIYCGNGTDEPFDAGANLDAFDNHDCTPS